MKKIPQIEPAEKGIGDEDGVYKQHYGVRMLKRTCWVRSPSRGIELQSLTQSLRIGEARERFLAIITSFLRWRN
jgi:hypothetical protein